MEEYYNDFFLAKEEIIKIRTIYLEFGNEKLVNELRKMLPYENISFLKSATWGYRAWDLYEPLLFYQTGKTPKLFELELLRYLGIPDYGIEWGYDRFLFIDDIPVDKLKIKLIHRYLYSLKHLQGIDETILDEDEVREIEQLERGIKKKRFDEIFKLIIKSNYESFHTKKTKNDFFNYLRNGLWYKKYNQFGKANNYLKKARHLYLRKLFDFRHKNLFLEENFDERIEQLQDAEIESFNTVLPESYIYWWNAYGKIIQIPLELQLEIEEIPSFHLGEIYIKKGDYFYKKEKFKKAYEAYYKAQLYLEEMKDYSVLGFGLKDSIKKNLVTMYIKIFFKNSKEKPSKDEINWVRKKVNDLFYSPAYLPLLLKPFKRNPYLEKALQRCELKLYDLKKYKEEKIKLLDTLEEENKLIKFKFPKKYEEDESIKNISDTSKEIVLKYYPKLTTCIDDFNKQDLYKAIEYELLEFYKKRFQFNSVINLLSVILEREINITIKRLNKIYKFSLKFNTVELGKKYYKESVWEKIQILLKNFGSSYFKIDNYQINDMIENIRYIQDVRNSCAHGISYGGLKDYEKFRTILLGKINKEKEGILYQIINLRYKD